MLSKEENTLLTQTGPGTPMGELFRRFWLPAIVATEAEVDGPPVRLRIMSEDLIAFRDSKGNVGIVDAYCRHKLAGLFWGRNEEEGIRCTYHGWKYDTAGNCVDMPNEPADSNFKNKIKLKAYPTREWGGLVWVYMGPADKMPDGLPQFEWGRVPADHRHVARFLQRTNYCQGLEGEFDNVHISFLHRFIDYSKFNSNQKKILEIASHDGAPQFTVRDTEYGLLNVTRRSAPDGKRYWWQASQWMLPAWSYGGNDGETLSGRAWVPVDDHHTNAYSYMYRVDRPFNEREKTLNEAGTFFPPRSIQNKFQMPDGYVLDIKVPLASWENDFLIDRSGQKTVNYTGVYGVNDQDRSIQEGMVSVEGIGPGKVVDRSKEHLGTTDVTTIAVRRRLIRMARDLENGIEPTAAHNGDVYRIRAPGGRFSDVADVNEMMPSLRPDAIAQH
jgi:phthalate 4,5-dioxygenase oxygenase subunit